MAQRMNPYDNISEMRGTSIPLFNQHGTALSEEEREAIAKKRGVCVKCGTKTHEVKMFKRIALTSDHVHEGKCIRCNPSTVPPQVLQAWEAKFKPTSKGNAKFRMAGRIAKLSVGAGQHHQPSGTASATLPQSPPPVIRPLVSSMGSSGSMPIVPPSHRSTSGQRAVPRSGTSDPSDYAHLNQLRPQNSGGGLNGNSISDVNTLMSSASNLGTKQNSLKSSSSNLGAMQNSSGSLNNSSRLHSVAVGSEGPMTEDYTGGNLQEDAWTALKVIRENKVNIDIVKQRLHHLRNIGDSQAGALYEVKELLTTYQHDPRITAVCAGALWGVTARAADSKVEAAECGAIDTLLDALRSPQSQRDADFVQWAIGCLSSLAQAGSNKQSIATGGGIEIILDCMRNHPSSAGVFEWSYRALHTLVFHYDNGDEEMDEDERVAITKNIISIDEIGGIPLIVEGMKTHSNESVVQLWALKVLWRLLDRDGNEALTSRVMERIVKAGGIGACVKILKARSTIPIVYELTAALLYSLLLSSGDDNIEKASDCMRTTIRTMTDYPKELSLQEACCNLLSILSSTNRLQFKELDGLQVIVAAMRSFIDEVTLQRAASHVLWKVSYIPAFFDMAYLEDAIAITEVAHNANPNDVELLVASCGFLANIATIGSFSPSIIPYRIPIHALSFKGKESMVADQGGRALANICMRAPPNMKRIVDAKGIELLVECLHSASPHALQGIYSALGSIAGASDDYKRKLVAAGCFDVAKSHIQMSSSVGLTDDALGLISIIANSEKQFTMDLPGDIFQVIVQAMKTHLTSPQSLARACGAVRDLLIVSSPGASGIKLYGLSNFLMELISNTSAHDVKREACDAVWALTARYPNELVDNLGVIFRTLHNVLSRYKGDEQQYNPDIQLAASGALASITTCLRNHPIDIEVNDVEAIVSVLYMVMEYDIENERIHEQLLDVLMDLSCLNEGVVIQCGGIVCVIDVMVEHEHSEGIQERGCSILALLSSTENLEVNICIAETDGIDMLVSALAIFSNSECIQVHACKALSHLSVDSESRMLITSQGGLILIVNAMNNNQDNVNLVEVGCSALLNLSSDADEQLIFDSHVIETVVSMMKRHPDSIMLHEKALGVLQNVSMRNAGAKHAISQAGGIQAVTASIKEFMGTASVLERAFTAMWSLAVLERNQVEVANAGGIQLVVNGMMANIHDVRVQKQACGCLCTLSANSNNKTLVRESGGVDAIVFAMWAHYDTEVLQVEACRALSSLAVNVQTNEVMIATDGEINAIISAMRLFPESEKLQEHACVALRNFLLSADNADLVRTSAAEVRALMVHASRRFPDKCSQRAQQVMASLG